ncbi:MAG: hypothetical protein Ct9H300mP25_05840 [Acidobacteriota bacterium]|nr:MAG: hypothetical protein Ct9H300mP25_05840 [Acidobacteriota bacterium]
MSLGAGGAGDDDNHFGPTLWGMALPRTALFLWLTWELAHYEVRCPRKFCDDVGVNGSGRASLHASRPFQTEASVGFSRRYGKNRVQVFNETTRSVWYTQNFADRDVAGI